MEPDKQLKQNWNRILVVDDDEVTRLFLESVLAEQGYDVTTAGDFESVRQALERERFSLVLMDLVFAGQDYSGFDILEHIKAGWPDCGIIIMTSHPCTHSAVRAVRIKAADYLMKPVRAAELIATVRRALDEMLDALPVSQVVNKHTHTPLLSRRERHVLGLLFRGYSYSEIAEALDCSISTAKTYGKRIYKKLGVRSRSEAIHEALHLNLIQK